MFRIEIETGNAAFVEQPGEEIGTILETLAENLRDRFGYAPDSGDTGGKIHDSNGNTVGSWQYLTD